jgi:hypothetical protein
VVQIFADYMECVSAAIDARQELLAKANKVVLSETVPEKNRGGATRSNLAAAGNATSKRRREHPHARERHVIRFLKLLT